MIIKPIHFLNYILILLIFFACEKKGDDVPTGSLQLVSVSKGTFDMNLSPSHQNEGTPVTSPIVVTFASALNKSSVPTSIVIKSTTNDFTADYAFLDSDKAVSIQPHTSLISNQSYSIVISDGLIGVNNESFTGLNINFKTIEGQLEITSLVISGKQVSGNARVTDVPLDLSIEVTFSHPVPIAMLTSAYISIIGKHPGILTISPSPDNKKITITTSKKLEYLCRYRLYISPGIAGTEGESFKGLNQEFYTELDNVPRQPVISDEELLTLVQRQTFKYFWDFAHPHSGLARERNNSNHLVTIGGSGFGLATWIVGVERGFITRAQAINRLAGTLDFLAKADRFHGVWPHWMDGNTGKTIPFSTYDNGADLVETAFMIQGLLTWKQYLNETDPTENALIAKIEQLYREVEWDWFTRGGQNVLYWHWSPNHEWRMNLPIRGYNEGLIIYMLAAASPTHPISEAVYHAGWARNGAIANGNNYYGIKLPLGVNKGGPLFFAHYSFLGLDPRGLSDRYANYFEQGRNHTLINRAYSIDNPLKFVGHGSNFWGLTAGDNPTGYKAHEPNNDNGTIQPTAALSSFPYTPVESMHALKSFYYLLGDRLWGEYGFYDGFNITQGWVATSYLAIDQGPIILMIENHRTGLLWDLFMANPEIDVALDKLDFNRLK